MAAGRKALEIEGACGSLWQPVPRSPGPLRKQLQEAGCRQPVLGDLRGLLQSVAACAAGVWSLTDSYINKVAFGWQALEIDAASGSVSPSVLACPGSSIDPSS